MATATIHSDFGAQKNKFVTISTFSSFICHEVMGPVYQELAFGDAEF